MDRANTRLGAEVWASGWYARQISSCRVYDASTCREEVRILNDVCAMHGRCQIHSPPAISFTCCVVTTFYDVVVMPTLTRHAQFSLAIIGIYKFMKSLLFNITCWKNIVPCFFLNVKIMQRKVEILIESGRIVVNFLKWKCGHKQTWSLFCRCAIHNLF